LLEVLERPRHDGVALNSLRAVGSARFGGARRWLRRLTPSRPRAFAGAALAATMVGIVINAVTLQHARHPNPLFTASPLAAPIVAASAPQSEPSSAGDPAPVPVPAPPAHLETSASSARPTPPTRPVGLSATNQAASSTRSGDPIAQILRLGASRDSRRLVTTAQNALVRLGYPIKMGASSSDMSASLRDFEKLHGLSVSTEITPRLVKLLEAAATTSSSR